MLIISLVLAVIGLAALVFAVITSNELVAWVCVGASVLGVVLLIIDALLMIDASQKRQRRAAGTPEAGATDDAESHGDEEAADYPAETVDESADTATYDEAHSPADDRVSDDHNTD